MLLRTLLLWVLDRARDVVALLTHTASTGQRRVQPLPDVSIDFREGWWSDLHPDDAAQLGGRWLRHATTGALLLFERLPTAPTLDLLLNTAPPTFRPGKQTHTARGVTVVHGSSLAGPTWLLWHPGASLVVVGKLSTTSPPWTVRRFLQSARATPLDSL